MPTTYRVLVKKPCDQCSTRKPSPCLMGKTIKHYDLEADSLAQAIEAAYLHVQMDDPPSWLQGEPLLIGVRGFGKFKIFSGGPSS